MENQHRKISGYRELTQVEIDLMNEVKALGPVIENVVIKLREHVKSQRDACVTHDMIPIVHDQKELERLDAAEPEKWLQWGSDGMQAALMNLTRAVAQPTFF